MLLRMSDTATVERTRPKLSRGPHNVAHKIGPHSRPHTLAKVDGRTKEAAVLNRVRADLTNHIGHPNIVQGMLIERCAWLTVRIEMLDRKIRRGESFTQVDSNTYLAWHNSLVRTLARLGIKRPDASATPAPLTRVLDELDDDTAA